MKGNHSDDLMATDGPSSDSSTELVSAFENGRKEQKRTTHRKMDRVDSRRRLQTESSSSGTRQPARRNSLTPPRQESPTRGLPQKTRSKAKAMEEIETGATGETRRLSAASNSPRRSAPSTYTRSGSGPVVRESRPRDLSVDAATRRSRERSIDAGSRRAHKRSSSKDRSTETQNSTAQPSSVSPRSIRQNAILDSVDSALQRRAGRKPDSLSTSRHGDPSSLHNQKLGTSTHGGPRRASVPDSLSTSRHASQTNKEQLQLRRSLSDDHHRKPVVESLDSSSHRRPARKDPLGGSRHGPTSSQLHSVSSHAHRSRSMERNTAPPATNQRRAAKKDDVLSRSRHGSEVAASQGLSASSHTRRRSGSGERRKQVTDSLGMVSQRRAARKDDLLGGSTHEPNPDRVTGTYPQRRSNGGTSYTPMTPSNTVKPNVDCFKNLSRLLTDTTISPGKTDTNQVDSNSHDDDNTLMDLLTTDLTPKQLRRALRARKKVEEAKSTKQQEQEQQDEDDGSDKQANVIDTTELEEVGIVLDPSTSFEQHPTTSNDVEQHEADPTEDFNQAFSSGFSVDADSIAAQNFPSQNETTTTTSVPRSRQFRRHTMDHAPKHSDPEPQLPESSRSSHFQRSTSVGAIEKDEDSNDQTRPSATGLQVSTKRRFGKIGEVQLEAMKRDRNNRKQSVKESILSILDE